jgi:hypothetical protein
VGNYIEPSSEIAATVMDEEIADIPLETIPSPPNFTDLGKLEPERRANVNWLASTGVTTGTTPTKYSPKNATNRGAMAQFMRRLVGKPRSRDPLLNPFVDIYTLAEDRIEDIMWLYSEAVTKGSDATHYSPKNATNRGAMAEFLWNLAGKPKIEQSVIDQWQNFFTDVSSDKKINDGRKKAIYWLASKGITVGADDPKHPGKKKYMPWNTTNRGAMADFLHRFYNFLHE